MKRLEQELATMKIMIYSLYKSLTGDEELNEVKEWEIKCEEIAKRILLKGDKE